MSKVEVGRDYWVYRATCPGCWEEIGYMETRVVFLIDAKQHHYHNKRCAIKHMDALGIAIPEHIQLYPYPWAKETLWEKIKMLVREL